MGSPTTEAVSGTVEEIDRVLNNQKPVHLYFSTAPLPHDVDTNQINGLRDFKRQIQNRGLYGEFATAQQLEREIWKAVEHDVNSLDTQSKDVTSHAPGVKFKVQSRGHREPKGLNKRGKMEYVYKHWYEITNIGDTDATDVTFSMSKESEGVTLRQPDHPISLQQYTTWKLPAVYTGSSDFGGV